MLALMFLRSTSYLKKMIFPLRMMIQDRWIALIPFQMVCFWADCPARTRHKRTVSASGATTFITPCENQLVMLIPTYKPFITVDEQLIRSEQGLEWLMCSQCLSIRHESNIDIGECYLSGVGRAAHEMALGEVSYRSRKNIRYCRLSLVYFSLGLELILRP